MDDDAQAGFTFYYCVGHAHFTAEGGKEDDEFDGVDVVGDQDEIRFFVFDQADDVVEAVFDGVGFLAHVLLLLAFFHGRGFFQQSFVLLGFGLGLVFVQELEGLGGGVAVEDVGELGDGWGYFEAEVEDLLLALETYVFGPFDHAGEVAAGLDILADAEVAGTLFDEGVLFDENSPVSIEGGF